MCATCRYFAPVADIEAAGACHRFPPSLAEAEPGRPLRKVAEPGDPRSNDDAPRGPFWQTVAPTDWCGERRPAMAQ
jgi:hypothetical protein